MRLNMELTSALGIGELYDAVAYKATAEGIIGAGEYRYDCTKIVVSNQIADLVEQYYQANCTSDWKLAFGMDWCCYGPKVDESLTGMEVEIQDGFFKEEEVQI